MTILSYFPKPYKPRPDQAKLLLEFEHNLEDYDVFVITMPTGCHDPDQLVLKADGRQVPIKEIKVGDQLLGPDGTARNVLKIHTGIAPMAEIIPNRSAPFKVTRNHILNLRRYSRIMRNSKMYNTITYDNISVEEYIKKSDHYKHLSTLWRAPQMFQEKKLVVPPYILGVWLGDGHTHTVAVTNPEPEIYNEWISYGRKLNCDVRIDSQKGKDVKSYFLVKRDVRNNPILDLFRSIGVINNKHIPLNYLTASRQQRLELLAGLIDTDGYYDSKKHSTEIIQKVERLADDILYLCWSLGFSANKTIKYVNNVPYYRCHISGIDINNVPCRLLRKKPQNTNNNQSNRKFKVKDGGIGPYYGVTVDKDSLYLMGDFTVTHNSGKTFISKTLIDCFRAGAIINPSNLLVDQFIGHFPKVAKIYGKSSYKCLDKNFKNCENHIYDSKRQKKKRTTCEGCPWLADNKRIKPPFTKKYVTNFHLYTQMGKYQPLLITDESHNLISYLQEYHAVKINRRRYKYPRSNSGYIDRARLKEWVLSLQNLEQILEEPERGQKGIKELYYELCSDSPKYLIKEQTNPKGELELMLCPIDIREAPPILWPSGRVKKIILMSATISEQDVKQLGLNNKRVKYLESESPIPPERRPVYYLGVAKVSGRNIKDSAPLLAKEIIRLAKEYPNDKGLIHATYSLARELREFLREDNRFLFHTRENKKQIYQRFRASSEPLILVASGLYEGIDLPDDAGRFQIIAKVPFPNLGEPAVRYKASENPDYYKWETLKTLMQACGRICRGPEDMGATFIIDSNFEKLYRDSEHLIPNWFKEAVIFKEDSNV